MYKPPFLKIDHYTLYQNISPFFPGKFSRIFIRIDRENDYALCLANSYPITKAGQRAIPIKHLLLSQNTQNSKQPIDRADYFQTLILA